MKKIISRAASVVSLFGRRIVLWFWKVVEGTKPETKMPLGIAYIAAGFLLIVFGGASQPFMKIVGTIVGVFYIAFGLAHLVFSVGDIRKLLQKGGVK